MFLMLMFDPTPQPTDKRRSVDVSGSKDEDVRHSGLTRKPAGSERAQPRIAVLRLATGREILGCELVDQRKHRRDVDRVARQFVRIGDGDASAVAGCFDARATGVCGGKVFCDDGLHGDDVFDRA